MLHRSTYTNQKQQGLGEFRYPFGPTHLNQAKAKEGKDEVRWGRVPGLQNPLCGYIYIYIYAVKLKTGPIVALFKVKNWSIFLFFCFLFLKISFSLQKEEDF